MKTDTSPMSFAMMLGLAALGLPRTVLEDLGIVAANSSILYYVLALTPFAVWLTVAVLRASRRPLLDFLFLGIVYGISLLLVHQILWNAGPSLGHNPPQSAIDFAGLFAPEWQELALRAYTSGVALAIGAGTGLVIGLIARVAHAWRSRRARRSA